MSDPAWSAAIMGTYPVVDTGQTKCYNSTGEISTPSPGQSFYGQDAQYAGNQPSYTLSSDGMTVFDNVTGLTWMRGPNTTLATPVKSDKKTVSQAQAWVSAVNTMNYGGFSDWRLPTIKELYSLMDFRGADPSGLLGNNTSGLKPFIDTTYFKFAYGDTGQGERIIDSQYVSSNVFVVNPAETGSPKVFGLNLADGRIKGYDLRMPEGSEKTFFVQLVRGAATYGANRFTENGDGTITDNATGLMWPKGDSGSAMTWQSALAWAQTRNVENYLGYSDWRLPNAKELHTLVNYANAPDFNGQPAIDTTYFSCTGITNENGTADFPYYWTSTTHGGTAPGMEGERAVYIAFGRALGWPANGWVDVHGAGCQRSDPKIGPPYALATVHAVTKNGNTYTGYSFGPQGDAIRGYNFLRLVRTASTGGSTSSTSLPVTFTITTSVPVTTTTTIPITTTSRSTTTSTTLPSVMPPNRLYLNGDRFEVTVRWKNYNDGSTGQGIGVKLSTDSGYFWFFSDSNVELVIKILDGRPFNGYYWVLYGALSDIEYTLTVKDRTTGAEKNYYNPPHKQAGNADILAFPAQG